MPGTAAATMDKMAWLKAVPIFSDLTKRQLAQVARLCDHVSEPAGTVLTRQGHLGREFILIVEGQARAERDGAPVARLGPGDFFGEMSLIDGKPRTATVVAESPCELLVVDRHAFTPLLETVPGLQRGIMLNLVSRLREAYAADHRH